MRIFLALIFFVAQLSACSQVRTELAQRENYCPGQLVSLEEATQIYGSCKVKSIFQPHRGPVIFRLTDSSVVCFKQPHIDWVMHAFDGVCPQADISVTIE